MSESTHVDVAAYALGGLDKDEDEAFRVHLDQCPACWAELERMVDVTALLSRLDPAEVLGEPEMPGPHVLEGMFREVRSERRASRQRGLLAAAAAVVLIVAGPIVARSVDVGGSDQDGQPPAVVAAPRLAGTVYQATNGGVTARVGLESKGWGTNIGLELAGVTGPLECELVAVSKYGTSRVVSSWKVPPKGYGVPSQPKPLLVFGGAGVDTADIDRLEVRTSDGRTLVQVPVHA
jgi:hypothetical protein